MTLYIFLYIVFSFVVGIVGSRKTGEPDVGRAIFFMIFSPIVFAILLLIYFCNFINFLLKVGKK